MTGVATLLLLFIPFLPGLRDIPRWIPGPRLIWRDWNQKAASGSADQPESSIQSEAGRTGVARINGRGCSPWAPQPLLGRAALRRADGRDFAYRGPARA